MNYPEFNALSIISVLVSFASMAAVYYFVTKVSSRLLRLEKKVVDIIENLQDIHGSLVKNRRAIRKKQKINYMEGDMDLVAENKKATFKAIYYPKKIQNSED